MPSALLLIEIEIDRRAATSKCHSLESLERIATFGFRGYLIALIAHSLTQRVLRN